MSCDKFQDEPLTAGDSRTVMVTVQDTPPGGATVPVDLTGWAITATLVGGGLSLTKTIGSGITVTSAVDGEFELALLPADTSALMQSTRLLVTIRISQGGSVYTVLRGKYLSVLV